MCHNNTKLLENEEEMFSKETYICLDPFLISFSHNVRFNQNERKGNKLLTSFLPSFFMNNLSSLFVNINELSSTMFKLCSFINRA